MTTRTTKDERAEAITRLRELCPPGTTIYTVLNHVSRSGMQREITAYAIVDGAPQYLSGYIAKALDYTRRGKRDGNVVNGCGMDMGFHLVYELSYALYPKGFGCIGQGCPSNDHSNGDRNYTAHLTVGGCQIGREPCTCHDPSAWTFGRYPNGCSDCGCHRVQHWHNEGGYALSHRWL